jgi:hypothetical protein
MESEAENRKKIKRKKYIKGRKIALTRGLQEKNLRRKNSCKVEIKTSDLPEATPPAECRINFQIKETRLLNGKPALK